MWKTDDRKVKTILPMDKLTKKRIKILALQQDTTFENWVNIALQKQLETESAQDPQPEAVAMGG